MRYTEKIKVLQKEKEVIQKCKLEAQNEAMREKEQKLKAVLKLQSLSIITPNEKEKKKAEKMAHKFANQLDLTEVFKVEQKKNPEDL
mmetsp:Transcript_6958/g.5214  ORF Transcript_6958/g.5214 Transcript_6958/m.5214 type:complete len:87 (+) Transcript_6958:356-616(+)